MSNRRQARPSRPAAEDVDWEALYRHHFARLRRAVARRLPPDEVDDAVQETFIRACRSWPPADPEASIESWLGFIARCVMTDAVRHRFVWLVARGEEGYDTLAEVDVAAVKLDESGSLARVLSMSRRRPGRPTMGSVTLVADDDAAYFSTGERWDAESEQSA